MTAFKRIFVGIDFSPSSDEALRQAYNRALSTGAQLAACHIVPNELRSNLLFPHLSRRDALSVPIGVEQAAETVLMKRVSEITGADAGIEIMADHGTPHAEILKRAEEWGADLIVVGSHGLTHAAGVFLGSVTNKVIRYAHCAVLVSRRQKGTRRIVAGTDFSDPALPAISAAFDEARRTESDLTLIHCLELNLVGSTTMPAGLAGPISFVTVADQAELEKVAREKLAEAAASFERKPDLRVINGGAALTLLNIAEEEQTDLIVVGTVGCTGLTRVLLGSVAENVASRAPCSVLVVRLHSRT